MRLSRSYAFCAQGSETRSAKDSPGHDARNDIQAADVTATCVAQVRDQRRAECVGVTRTRNMATNVHHRVTASENQGQKMRPTALSILAMPTIPAVAVAPTLTVC
jgi:hypothetical protein